MQLTLNTPALLFPAISLLLLAYTNRFLHLASLIRTLHAQHKQKPDPLIIAQIGNLRFRLGLIKNMQFLGVSSLFGCVLCMFVLFTGHETLGKIVFGLSLCLMMSSLGYSIWEIRLSAVALNLHLSDLEQEELQSAV
ncbi:MAG: DUF2721 domain-containing protein [Armatimonadetes bacterium]|nr:DUF2721 domain-containing protein [Armatimonadota bacterium]